MLKVYVFISIATTMVTLLTNIRTNTKNIKDYIQKYQPKRTNYEKWKSRIEELIWCWIPIWNLVVFGLAVFLMCASDLTVIELLSKSYKKKKNDNSKIKDYLERG